MFLIARNWWAVAVRGVCGILFGLGAVLWPGIAIAVLVLLFGIYALVDGVFAIISAVRAGAKNERWGSLAVEGIVGIIAGIWAVVAPNITAVALVAVIAAWAVITGVLEIIAAVRLRKMIRGEWVLGLFGVISIAFGLALGFSPIAGALILALWIGAYAFAVGVLQLVLAFKLRHWRNRIDSSEEEQERLAA
ncbi:MAG: hypothetical protein CXZ00_08190 [Acidobacteria bacterium]|nr:MAG: hypothetical protein CXZ00_08190 [Acidobacteriota bacterium]